MSTARVTLAVLLALVAGAPAAAQITEKQAVAENKKSGKNAFNAFKGDLKTADVVFMAQLKNFEQDVKDGNFSRVNLRAMFDDLLVLQASIKDALNTASNSMTQDTRDTLQALGDGNDLASIYPRPFYAGSGGPWDKLVADVEKTLDKFYAKLTKRLAKTAKLIESQAGWGVTFLVRAPGTVKDRAANQFSTTSRTNSPITIDTVMAYSDLSQMDDGELCIAGSSSSNPDVDVLVAGAFGDAACVAPDIATQRWDVFLDDGGQNFNEGNAVIIVDQGGGGIATATIGMP